MAYQIFSEVSVQDSASDQELPAWTAHHAIPLVESGPIRIYTLKQNSALLFSFQQSGKKGKHLSQAIPKQNQAENVHNLP